MDKKNTPEVKLGQYKGLAVTRHVRPVTDKTVDIELVHQARMHAVYHPTTEPAKRGFRALLDFAGYMDGKEIPDSRMEKVMVVLGDGKLMPAAEQAIYGHRAGEVFRFDFTYPQDFRLPELSGKTAQFEIELRSLAEKVTPAPDEAFAKSLGFDSLDALKADLRAKKQKIHEEGADRAAGKQLLDMAGANMTVDLPAEILDRTAQNEMKLLKERLSRSGITLEQHCKNSRTTPEALEKDYRAQAESRIRFVLAAKAIAAEEACTEEYRKYIFDVVKNCKAMCDEFVRLGYDVVTGGTDNHLFLLDLSRTHPELTGKAVQDELDRHGITLNKNCVPNEKRSPVQTSGVRIGTAAETTKGKTAEDFVEIAREIDRIISAM